MTYYGIYKITNKVNGKMYIGQHTTDSLDDGYLGSGVWLKNAVKKYGKEAFTKEWLEFAENADDLNYLEQLYVDEEWCARPDVYNLIIGGGVRVGFKHTEKSRQTMSAKAKDRLKTKTNHPRYGQHLTLAQKERQHLSHLGQTSPMKGKQHSEETKRKLSKRAISRNCGRHWYNDGKRNIFSYECPEGFVGGRI